FVYNGAKREVGKWERNLKF
ncbi:hypothetical protein EVA_17300, partial [gut metagenome]